jgi:hypothetical protein
VQSSPTRIAIGKQSSVENGDSAHRDAYTFRALCFGLHLGTLEVFMPLDSESRHYVLFAGGGSTFPAVLA